MPVGSVRISRAEPFGSPTPKKHGHEALLPGRGGFCSQVRWVASTEVDVSSYQRGFGESLCIEQRGGEMSPSLPNGSGKTSWPVTATSALPCLLGGQQYTQQGGLLISFLWCCQPLFLGPNEKMVGDWPNLLTASFMDDTAGSLPSGKAEAFLGWQLVEVQVRKQKEA